MKSEIHESDAGHNLAKPVRVPMPSRAAPPAPPRATRCKRFSVPTLSVPPGFFSRRKVQEGVADYGVAADSAEDAADAAEDAIHETEAMDVAWQESGAPLPNKKNKIDL